MAALKQCLSVSAAFIALVVNTIAYAAPSTSAMSASQPSATVAALPRSVVAGVESTLKAHNVPGAVVAIVGRNGRIEAGFFGFRDLARTQAVTPDTCFRLGSVSKTFTALLALRLANAGALELDGELPESLRPSQPVSLSCTTSPTLRQLLEHTSGLPGSSFRDYEENVANRSPTELVQSRERRHLAWCPNLHYAYSNRGYSVAAALIESASKSSFDRAMQEEVFSPLGMQKASFATDPLLACAAESSDQSGEVMQTPWLLGDRAAGALVAPPLELAGLVEMLINHGSYNQTPFLHPEQVRTMAYGRTGLAPERAGFQSTYGLGQFRFVAAGALWHGHWGRIDGFQTTYAVLPESGLGMIVALNSANKAAMNTLREALAREIVNRMQNSPVKAPTVVANDKTLGAPVTSGSTFEETLLDRSGWYANVSHDMPLRAWLWNTLDVLAIDVEKRATSAAKVTVHASIANAFMQWFGSSARQLNHVRATAFREASLSEPTAGFATASNGDAYWIDGESYERTHWSIAIGKIALFAAGVACFALAVIAWPLRVAYVAVRRHTSIFHRRDYLYPDAFWVTYALGSALILWLFYAFAQAGILGGLDQLGSLGKQSALSWSLAIASVAAGAAFIAAAVHLIFVDAQFRRKWAWLALAVALMFCARLVSVGWLPLVTWR
jgi:CubicO group peptidase (beta-lactamase class C family)